MLRWLVVLTCLVAGCKKKEQEEPAPEPSKPSTGHSVTKIDEQADPAASGSSTTTMKTASGEAAADAGAADAPTGAYRDKTGHVFGPGGPLSSRTGAACDDKANHCLREGTWFTVGNMEPGKIYRAIPVFEFEGKWWDWYGREANDFKFIYRTEVAKPGDLKPNMQVVWFIDEGAKKFEDNENDMQTSSRWDAGHIESVSGSTIKIKGWHAPIPVDTVRVIVQKKGY